MTKIIEGKRQTVVSTVNVFQWMCMHIHTHTSVVILRNTSHMARVSEDHTLITAWGATNKQCTNTHTNKRPASAGTAWWMLFLKCSFHKGRVPLESVVTVIGSEVV